MDQLGPRKKQLTPLATKRQDSLTIPTMCQKMKIKITVMGMPMLVTEMLAVTEMLVVTEMAAVMEMAVVMEMVAVMGMAVASTGVATEAVGVMMAAVAEENESSL